LDEFASVVSHDLRNPLNVANGRIALLQEDYDLEELDAVEQSLDRMREIIEGVLSLAREGQTVNETEIVSLGRVANRAWLFIESNEAEIRIDTDGELTADPSRLQDLLTNLFRNAIEHGGSDVTIRVGMTDRGFYISDDGPGIPADERDSIFEPGHTNTDNGTGLGLAIVRRIAEAHGWLVEVSASQSGGTRFDIHTNPPV